MNKEKWIENMLLLTETVRSFSKDPNVKVGAIITRPDFRTWSGGYNGFPRGIEDTPERLNNPEVRRSLMVHAEQNAIINAPFDTRGCFLFCSHVPCFGCCKVIIQAGIVEVYISSSYINDIGLHWKCQEGEILLAEANIKYKMLSP